jgi:hypothetical protein
MRLIKVHHVNDMPKTLFTAEELSTFIRKSILVCVAVTMINGVGIFVTTCVNKKQNQGLKNEIAANRQVMAALTSTVATDIEADREWRHQLDKANPKIKVPKLSQPTPPPVPKQLDDARPPKPVATASPAVIVVPSPPPIIKKEVIVKRVKPKPTATPFQLFNWRRHKATR